MSVGNSVQPKRFGGENAYLRRVVAASMAGTAVEWYEFFLYGTAATLVFGKVFFPNSGDELAGILAAFVTYVVGFAARPLGGIVFGHLGDKYGRKQLLQLSLLLMGELARGRCARREHPGDRGAACSHRDAVGCGVSQLGLARCLLVVRGRRVHRLLHPQQGIRRAHLPRSTTPSTARQGVAIWRRRGVKALSPWCFTAMGLRVAENTMYYLVVTFSITYLKVQVHA
jgi:MFS family permease